MASFGSKSFQRRAAQINASQGNSPGFPNQFAELNLPHGVEKGVRPNVTPEYISIDQNGPMNIRQTRSEKSRLGRYESLPQDIPFDYRQEERKESYMTLMGMSLILVGIYLSYKSP